MRGRSGLLAVFAAILAPCAATAGSTRCWIDHGAVVVSAAFGAITGDFVIDLSRAASAISVTRANAEGLTGEDALATLRLAGHRWAAARLAVVDLDADTRRFDTSINGVLGWDVLGRVGLDLDMTHDGCQLTLGPFPRAFPGGAARRVKLTLVSRAPAVVAVVTDGATTEVGLFALDTAHAETRVVDATPATAPAAQGATFRLRALSVAGCLFEAIAATPGSSPAQGPAGALGVGLLRGGRLRIDPARGAIDLKLCRS